MVALDDVLQPAAMARADNEQVRAFGLGDVAQGAGRREIGVHLNDRLGGKLVAHRAQRVLDLCALLGVGVGERQRRVVVNAHEHEPGPGGRSEGSRQRDRPAAALVAVTPGDDGPIHRLTSIAWTASLAVHIAA